jgi:hypothetical protein
MICFFDLEFDALCFRRRDEQSCYHAYGSWAAPRRIGNAGEGARVSAACAAGEPSGHRCDVIAVVWLQWHLTLSVLGKAMNNLGNTYRTLGRYQDALVMGEKTLGFRRRVLPENHPDIGAVRLWLLLKRGIYYSLH